ncbi:MAG: hypothetical protein AB8B70_05365 [Prochlorococcus sp.]
MKPVTNEQWITYFERNHQLMPPELLNKALRWSEAVNSTWCTSLGKPEAYVIRAAKLYYERTGIPLRNYDH